MNRSARLQHALPLTVLAFFTLVDVLIGRDQQVLSLVVITPLAAARRSLAMSCISTVCGSRLMPAARQS